MRRLQISCWVQTQAFAVQQALAHLGYKVDPPEDHRKENDDPLTDEHRYVKEDYPKLHFWIDMEFGDNNDEVTERVAERLRDEILALIAPLNITITYRIAGQTEVVHQHIYFVWSKLGEPSAPTLQEGFLL